MANALPLRPAEISGSRITSARKAAGLSQADLARKLGTTQPTISKLEAGDIANPSWETIGRLSKIVGCNPLTIIEPYFETDRKPARRRSLHQVAS